MRKNAFTERGINMELSVVTNHAPFNNKNLEKATNLIFGLADKIRANQYTIAAILAEVDAKQYYVDDGFESCAAYAESTFGVKKTVAYNMITIGREYTRPIVSESGRTIGYCSNLLPPANPDKQDAPVLDFSTRQISDLKVLGREKVVELIDDGEIKPQMTHAEMVKVIKEHKPPKPAKESEQTEPEQPEQTEPEQPEPIEVKSVGVERDNGWDNASTDMLIAELYARGFKVYKDGVETPYKW